MKFKTKDGSIIYCKNDHYKEFNNSHFCLNVGTCTNYYKGYLIHRKHGPAIEWNDGDKYWSLNGKRHREDGPAVERITGEKTWYLNGKRYSEEEYLKIMNLKNKKKILNEV